MFYTRVALLTKTVFGIIVAVAMLMRQEKSMSVDVIRHVVAINKKNSSGIKMAWSTTCG